MLLKYLFSVKYANSLTNFFKIKSCINYILKYLLKTKKVKIVHSLENKLENEKNKMNIKKVWLIYISNDIFVIDLINIDKICK